LFQKVPSKTASAKKIAVSQPADSPVPAADEAVTAPAEVETAVEADTAAVAPVPVHAAPVAEQEKAVEPPAEKLAIPANDISPPRHHPVPPRPMGQQMGGPRPPGGMQGGRIMPPPRAMAKAENFVEGDHVVYPTHGVGKVERIATEEIAGHKLELIHITFEENRMTLRVPVAKARSAGLRKLASRKMFDEALAVLKGRARIKRTMWSRRAQEYEAKINSGDPLAIAEVVRDLHRNAGQPDQSFSERQIYEAAMDRLAAELGALERIDKVAAATKLAEFLKTV
jgi:CarD family transcriptional regulator